MTQDVFDQEAARYDAWYESPVGAAAFAQEIDALRPLLAGLLPPAVTSARPWRGPRRFRLETARSGQSCSS